VARQIIITGYAWRVRHDGNGIPWNDENAISYRRIVAIIIWKWYALTVTYGRYSTTATNGRHAIAVTNRKLVKIDETLVVRTLQLRSLC
jgi:hypothetical protein